VFRPPDELAHSAAVTLRVHYVRNRSSLVCWLSLTCAVNALSNVCQLLAQRNEDWKGPITGCHR
jgi:hypothetical protein